MCVCVVFMLAFEKSLTENGLQLICSHNLLLECTTCTIVNFSSEVYRFAGLSSPTILRKKEKTKESIRTERKRTNDHS